MALHCILNKSGMGGNHTTWWDIRAKLLAGWTVVESGSGTGGTYSGVAGGNVFDLAAGQNPFNYVAGQASGKLASGAGTEPWCAAPLAWIVLKAPGPDGAELLIQRGTTGSDAGDSSWTKIEAPGGFAWAGAPRNASTAPAAAATPGAWYRYTDTNPNSVGANIYQVGTLATLTSSAADDTPSVPGHPLAVPRFPFITLEFRAGNILGRMFCRDPLQPCSADLQAALPIRYYLGSTSHYSSAVSPTTDWRRVHDFGGAGQSVLNAAGLLVNTGAWGAVYPANAGSPVDGQADMPQFVGFSGGFVGLSSMVLMVATARAYPDYAKGLEWWYLGAANVAVRIGDGVTLPGSI